ncbi:hypothetical protein COOONC_07493 [Cooperia oncophora]
MGFARYIIPRRKENVLNFLIVLAFCAGVVFYIRLENENRFLSRKESRPSKRSWEPPPVAPGAPGENGLGVALQGEDKKQGEDDMKKWFMNVRAR